MDSGTPQRNEQKYVFINQHQDMLLEWLEHCCIPDPAYHTGTVSSIYYDTPALSLYDEKRNGDFLKCKVRLRWYGDLEKVAPEIGVSCYFETKQKFGALCGKERMELKISAKRLAGDPLFDEQIQNLPARTYNLSGVRLIPHFSTP